MSTDLIFDVAVSLLRESIRLGHGLNEKDATALLDRFVDVMHRLDALEAVGVVEGKENP